MDPKGLLLVAFCLLHVAIAASVAVTQNPEDSALALLEVNNPFYPHKGRQCRKCLPGFRVKDHCTPGVETTCHPCDNDTFSKHLNALKACFPCKTCRQFDEVELQPCTTTSDTLCACKNGTFCLPHHPCETCHKCRLRCPEGQQMVKPCTSTSDIECDPYVPSPTPPTETGFSRSIIGIIVGCSLAGFLVLLAVTYRKKFRCCTRANSRGSTAGMWRFLPSLKDIQCLQRNCGGRRGEEADNMWNTQVDQESPLSSESSTHRTSNMSEMMLLPTTTTPEEESQRCATERRRDLLPADGKDPVDALRSSFDIFIKEVPVKEWWRYMRALGLTDNEITRAERNHKDLEEQQFQMLRTWLDKSGKEASVNTLLKTLRNNELKGVEEKMRACLIFHGLYYEE
ncbi:tumor necrosis factor receptor superfamily member 10B-like isoform X2 [Sceloporus undulatus]|uniref:tumor necrosis factor receptor superfamily member 10B-like isoform X2 n=1 Tax=Sceloporus undulatus TaxID=8520 RepID=UPI001C4C31C6|nr:tumor necrosis factor receptor superfamily member 10B-like isoform X2 [Sceloporus undulatus]